MTNEIFFDGKRYLPAGEVAQSSNLTRDYVARLCREGKVRGKQVGKNWYVEHESFKSFLVGKEYAKSVWREALSKQRALEYAQPVGNPAEEFPALATTVGATPIYTKLADAVTQQGAKTLEKTSELVFSPSGMGEAALRLTAQSAAHIPTYAITPLAEFAHKLIALTLAVMLTLGTYALVDPQAAHFAADSVSESAKNISDSYAALTGPAAQEFVKGTLRQVAAAAENPRETAAVAASGIGFVVPNVLASFARAVNEKVNGLVYSIAFPQTLLASFGSQNGSVAVEVQPYARPVSSTPLASSAGPATRATVTVIKQPIIQQTTERIVEAGGISEAELTDKLNQLNNKLVAQIYGITASAPSLPATGGFINNIAISNRIDRLSGVTITNSTIDTASIPDLSGTYLPLNGTGTSTIAGNISVAGNINLNGKLLQNNAAFLSSQWTTSGSSVYYNSGNIGVGTTTPWAKLSIHANNGDTNTTLFAIASSTASATTTLFSIDNTGNATLSGTLTVGSCVGCGGGGSDAFTHPASGISATTTLMLFSGNASTTNFSNFGTAYFGGTATSSFDSSGALALASSINFTGINSTSTLLRYNGQQLLTASSTTNSISFGLDALGSTSSGVSEEIALGTQALFNDVSGSDNFAAGYQALYSNTTGYGNNALGLHALFSNTDGLENNAIGDSTLYNNTSGKENNAFGDSVLFANTTGNYNIGIGYLALHGNGTGSDNIALGYQALLNNTSGYDNVRIGNAPDIGGSNVTTGYNNILFGYDIVGTSSASTNFLNIGNLLFGTLPATSTYAGNTLKLPTSGAIGIGTSSPFATFAIHANNGSTNTTLFAIGSSTASATTTLFSIDNTGNATLAGTLTVGSCVGCGSGGGGSDAFTHPASGISATTTLMLFSGNASSTNFSNFGTAYFGGTATSTFASDGSLNVVSAFTAYASSTIGNGTQAGGLTISGGATTTGIAYFAGNVGIGTSTPSNGNYNGNILAIDNTVNGANNGLLVRNSSGNPQVGIAGNTSNKIPALYFYDTGASELNSIGALVLDRPAPTGAFSGSARNNLVLGTFSGAGSSVQLATEGVVRLTTTSTGNVGIGTTTPGAKLDVYGGATEGLHINNTNGTPYALMINNNTYGTSDATGFGIYQNNTGSVGFDLDGVARLLLATSSSNSDTNFTIGTNAGNGGYPLFVRGNNAIGTIVAQNPTASSFAQFVATNDQNAPGSRSATFGYSGSNTGTVFTGGPSGEQGFQGTVGAFPFVLYTNNTARITIAATGNNVGIGTSTNLTAGGKLNLATSNGVDALDIINTGSSNKAYAFYPNGNDLRIGEYSGAIGPSFSDRVTFQAGGNVGIGTTSPYDTLSIHDALGSTVIDGASLTIDRGVGYFSAAEPNQELRTTADLITFYNQANNTPWLTATNGSIGIGTTTPWARLSVFAGGDYASHAASTLFAIGSTTAGTATTTLFAINSAGSISTSLGSGLVKSTSGVLSLATAGTDYLNSYDAFTHPAAGQSATTSLVLLNGAASTTLLSAYGPAYFGATATSSFSTTGALTLVSALTYGGVTLNNAVTGTGNMVLSASPTLTGTLTAAAANFSGLLTSANASTSLLSVTSKAYFGGTATSSFNSAGVLDLADQGQSTSTILTLGGVQFLSASSSSSGANTFLGIKSGQAITSGSDNTAFGYQALTAGTSGRGNTAFGSGALVADTIGKQNTAVGQGALNGNVNGDWSIAVGESASWDNTSAIDTVAVGEAAAAGAGAYTAQGYTAVGWNAGTNFTTGASYNTLLGYASGYDISSGYGNTLIGANEEFSPTLTTGHGNVSLGYDLYFPDNTANNQLNIGGLIFGTLPATSTAFRLPTSGSIGIGTSSPFAKFSIHANNGDTVGTLFAIGSSTASATTTLFSVPNYTAGTSTFATGLQATYLNLSGTSATSTASNGFNITAGCFSVGGTCISGGTGLTSYDAFTHPSSGISATTTLMLFSGNASSTNFSNFGTAYFGGTATSSFNSAGVLDLADQGQSTSTVLTLGGVQFLSASSSVANTFLGLQAGAGITTGTNNTAFGYHALLSNTTGFSNVASGAFSLSANTTGYDNIANGYFALNVNTTGFNNIANGDSALSSNTSGYSNIAMGDTALGGNTTGYDNIAIGDTTLNFNSTGHDNVAAGTQALGANTTGVSNIANGTFALFQNTTGSNNIAIGQDALHANTTGSNNVANGFQALQLTTGSNNVAVGSNAGRSVTSGYSNTIIGDYSTALTNITTGYHNLALGSNIFFPSTTGNDQLNIGNLVFGTLPATSTAFALPTSGSIGIGTSSPFAKFSIAANNGDTAGTLFAIGSSTASATTTLFSVSNTGLVVVPTLGDSFEVGTGGISDTSYLDANGRAFFGFNGTDGNAVVQGIGGKGIEFNVNNSSFGSGQAMVITPAGNVGIGTTTPAYSLDTYTASASAVPLRVSSNQTATYLQLSSNGTFSTANSGYIGYDDSKNLSLWTANTQRLTIDSSGKVGVGVTSPLERLIVDGSTGASGFGVSYGAGSGFPNIRAEIYHGGNSGGPGGVGGVQIIAQGANESTSGSGNINFLTPTGNSANGSTDAGITTRMSILQNGNVGVGTTTPWAQLSVNPNGVTGPEFAVGSSTATSFLITNAGNVGVATTSPGSLFSVNGSANFYSSGTSSIYTDLALTGELNLKSSATSTASNGFNLTAGCFSVNGTCLSSASGLTSYDAFTHPAAGQSATTSLVLLNGAASTTLLSAYGPAYFGATATSSFSTTGALTLVSALTYGGVTLNNAVTGTGNMVLSASPTLTGTLTAAAANFSGLLTSTNASTSLLSVTSKAYFGGTSTTTIDSAGNIGVASSTPWANLAVNPIGGAASNQFVIGSSTATSFMVNNAGNVGIGTTSPSGKLDIYSSDGATQTLNIAQSSINGKLGIYFTDLYANVNARNWSFGASIANGFGWDVMRGTSEGATPSTLATRIDNNGNLGIGSSFSSTNAVGSKLSVQGNAAVGSSYAFLAAPTDGLIVQGNVGIGTTTPWGQLSVFAGGDYASHAASTLFAIGSSTAGTATTTLFSVSSAGATTITGSNGSEFPALTLTNGAGQANQLTSITFANTGLVNSAAIKSKLYSGGLDGELQFYTTQSSAVTQRAVITNVGNFGVATTSPWALLSVNPSGVTGPEFAVGSSTATSFLITNAGDVGIGTSNPASYAGYGTLTLNGSTGSDIDLYQNNSRIGEIFADNTGTNLVSTIAKPLNFSTNNLIRATIDSSGKVGIGTTTPTQAMLSIAANGGGSDYLDLINTNSGNKAWDLYPSGNDLRLFEFSGAVGSGGNDRLTIQAGGNVGIGTSTPGALLDINAGATRGLRITNSSNSPYALMINNTSYGFGDTNGFGFYQNNNGSGGIDVNNVVAATISTAGYFGIGTTTPWAKLSVNPNGVTGPEFAVGSSTATNFIVTNAGNVGIGTTSPQDTLHITGPASDGRGLLVTSPNASNDPQISIARNGGANDIFNLRVRGSSGGSYLSVWDQTNGTTDKGLILKGNTIGVGTTTPWANLAINPTAGAASNQFVVGSSTATSFIITNAGNVGVGTTSPGSLFSVQGSANFYSSGTSSIYTDLAINGELNLKSSATTTAANGFNITSGCYAVNGTCILGGNVTGLTSYDAFTHPATNQIATTTDAFGLGTTTPWANLAINPTAGVASNQFVVGSSTATSFIVNNSGYVGIGTTSPFALFSINPNGIGTIPAFAVGSSTAAWFTIDNGGKVGIGTTSPQRRLDVVDPNSVAQIRISNSIVNYAEEFVDAVGTLFISTSGGNIKATNENLFVCAGGACPTSTATSTEGNLFVENAVTIGDGFSLREIDTSSLGLYNTSGNLMVTFDNGI